MKLYGFPPSPNTWQVRALAAHLALPLEFELVDITKGASRTGEFLALNPTGRTPVLVDGDFKLWETQAVLQYLAGKKPTPLWPDDARTRADITRWQCWCLAHWANDAFVPALTERLVKKVLNLGPVDQAVVAKAEAAYGKEATMLDAHLHGRQYLVGEAPTIADFAVAAPVFYARQGELPLEPYAHVRAWFARVSGLPCWSETAPQLPAVA